VFEYVLNTKLNIVRLLLLKLLFCIRLLVASKVEALVRAGSIIGSTAIFALTALNWH
jgi:hypothetical protein